MREDLQNGDWKVLALSGGNEMKIVENADIYTFARMIENENPGKIYF